MSELVSVVKQRLSQIIPLLCLLISLCWAAPAMADELYQGTVPVTETGSQPSEAAIRQAMTQVLQKVTGDPYVAQRPAVAEALKQPNQYIQQFSYEQLPAVATPAAPAQANSPQAQPAEAQQQLAPAQTTPQAQPSMTQANLPSVNPASPAANNAATPPTQQAPATATPPAPQPVAKLKVWFDPSSINQLVRNAGETVWQGKRPQTIVWLGVQTANGRQLVGSTNAMKLTGAMTQAAAQYGLNVEFPLLDLQDMSHVTSEDVWAPFPWIIEKASRRYNADAILVGKAMPQVNSAGWQVKWTLLLAGHQSQWQSIGNDLTTALDNGMAAYSQALLSDASVLDKPQATSLVQLKVLGIQGVSSLATVSQYLKQLTPVHSVKVGSFSPHAVIFDVAVDGGYDALSQAIAMDHTLVPATTGNMAQNMSGQPLLYRLAS